MGKTESPVMTRNPVLMPIIGLMQRIVITSAAMSVPTMSGHFQAGLINRVLTNGGDHKTLLRGVM